MRTCDLCGAETPSTVEEFVSRLEADGFPRRLRHCWKCEENEHRLSKAYARGACAAVEKWLFFLLAAVYAAVLVVATLFGKGW